MVKTKHPGIGQGKGGGRPRRADDMVQVRLSLPGKVYRGLEARARQSGKPMWAVVTAALSTVGSADTLQGRVSNATTPPAPAPDLMARLVREAARLRDPQSGLCPVPALVLTCLGEHTLAAVHGALLQAARSRRLELRPESGMARLHPAELALCPVGLQDCRLSWARILDHAL